MSQVFIPFSAPYAPDDEALATALFQAYPKDEKKQKGAQALARDLILALRKNESFVGSIDDLLHAYSLSTKEGVALMILAEALLRIPDAATADKLIADKLSTCNFRDMQIQSPTALVSLSSWALNLARSVVKQPEDPHQPLSLSQRIHETIKHLGQPTIRYVARNLMQVMGNHFVFAQTITDALHKSKKSPYLHSFDMLGEGARTAQDADEYFAAYMSAIRAMGEERPEKTSPSAIHLRPSISIKLSALHPRYEAVSRERILKEMLPRVLELVRSAKQAFIGCTIDAEEADRLELSLEIIGHVLSDPELQGWDGFGLAIQAYQKRAQQVIAWVGQQAQNLNRRFTIRLVKGAYWDTEIRRAQERGLEDYPVFTRKAMTDLNYLACARQLLDLRAHIFPQFATHNALTVASILKIAGPESQDTFEFQRLHGMGSALYETLWAKGYTVKCRTYAPVGPHKDLLAYLVRRLLENGANSSFVATVADPKIPIDRLLATPIEILKSPAHARHAGIPMPRDLFRGERLSGQGVEFGAQETFKNFLGELHMPSLPQAAITPHQRPVISPIDAQTRVGYITETPVTDVPAVMKKLQEGFRTWERTPVEQRAACLQRAADLLERKRGELIALLQLEAGKTLDDSLSEVREAIDFCRYYGNQARKLVKTIPLPGPAGESNALSFRGRGVFVAISPWNFPLAIFLGQVTAALAMGNTVAAKPSEQTPLIAQQAVSILYESGIPHSALTLVVGEGSKVGAELVAHPLTAGVVFTGSTAVAHIINKTLANKPGPIVPLIAETGGVNAMIVDSSALPEQVVDDVILSSFRSAGQRCSALRLLCLQDTIADSLIERIIGAAQELSLGDPRNPSVHIGPIIDAEAYKTLKKTIMDLKQNAKTLYAGPIPEGGGYHIGPHIFEISRVSDVGEEVFGPVLKIVRYQESQRDALVDAIDALGYGLTLGIHSRIDETIRSIGARLRTGNVYVNRSMIGAVVETQPFGGTGLSGTGPKAGGPHYLARFATEQTLTINLAAAGGDAELLQRSEV
jgi:RHH-type proline utilization regulon transcriptional repressor/proline dehydrogenase/delta 1-pyrroline-5-carboxylate dehydrogenase